MKKFDLLGIRLTDYSLKETLRITNQYLNNGALNTITFISTQILVEAGENPEQIEWLEAIDLTICEEVDILRASDNATRNRMREVADGEFLREFIRRLAWNRKRIFLLTDSDKHMKQLEEDLHLLQDNLHIVGEYILEEPIEGVEGFVNEINDLVPNVIISRFPYPFQEKLMFENKKMINADIWLAIPEHNLTQTKKGLRKSKLLSLLYRKIFRKKLLQYNDKKTE